MDQDVVHALQVVSLEVRTGFGEVTTMLAELRASQAELRASQAELRASQAELRASQAELRSDITARLDTLFAALADLRSEYHNHTHGDG